MIILLIRNCHFFFLTTEKSIYLHVEKNINWHKSMPTNWYREFVSNVRTNTVFHLFSPTYYKCFRVSTNNEMNYEELQKVYAHQFDFPFKKDLTVCLYSKYIEHLSMIKNVVRQSSYVVLIIIVFINIRNKLHESTWLW